jgi:hypothetical protein
MLANTQIEKQTSKYMSISELGAVAGRPDSVHRQAAAQEPGRAQEDAVGSQGNKSALYLYMPTHMGMCSRGCAKPALLVEKCRTRMHIDLMICKPKLSAMCSTLECLKDM